MLTKSDLRKVNREFRTKESTQADLWPVTRMPFDFAERVIAVAGYHRELGGECYDAEEYRALLDSFASQIVNDSQFWRIGLRSTLRLMYDEE